MATKKIKVSQKTITQIKNLGMTKALAAGKTVRSAEFQEGLRRMYGSKRTDAARYSGKNKSVPVGGVMGTSKNNKVMGGTSVKSTMKPAKKTAAKKVVKSNGLGAGVSVPVSMRTKSAKKPSLFNKKLRAYK
jgi:hypothetical protein